MRTFLAQMSASAVISRMGEREAVVWLPPPSK